METDVHFPTDINLLWDAIRKVVNLTADLGGKSGLTIWRQSAFNLKQFKKQYRHVQKLKHSTSKNQQKQEAKKQEIIEAHDVYLQKARALVEKAQNTLSMPAVQSPINFLLIEEIQLFIAHAERQIAQIDRRVIRGETIPHDEKVFSIFEEHTEWISKGKAGVPVELGLRTCILEDQYGFILHHHVMEKQTDDQVAVSMASETQTRFPDFKACSFDKGFHSPGNQKDLRNLLEHVVLPKKGRLNQTEKEREYTEAFQAAKRQHSAVESGINALEVHGLDKCPDHGIHGFKRYVALAVVARNIQKLGAELRKQEQAIAARRKRAA